MILSQSNDHRIRIAIHPQLKLQHGPEVCWTWRLLLSGMGFAWEEVPFGSSECDIVYTFADDDTPAGRLFVLASPERWQNPAHFRLARVRRSDTWRYPVYRHDPSLPALLHRLHGRVVCRRDLIFDVFWLATGQEERHWPKDVHGHADLTGSAMTRDQVLRQALATNIASGLENLLHELCPRPSVARWPDGKRAAVCLGHDVDYPEVLRLLEPLRILLRQGIRGIAPAVSVACARRGHWHFSSWVELEKQHGARSAFYFVPRKGSLWQYASGTPDPFYDIRLQRFKALFPYLLEQGFEIGMHASYRAFENRQTFAAEKHLLQEASGAEIVGNRHHYWHLDPENPEDTLLLHEQTGFRYDSSLVHERYLGWRRGLSWPFFPFHQQEKRQLETLQLAPVWMDDQLFGHKRDNPGERTEILRSLTATAAQQGGCLVVDIHDYVFDNTLYPGWRQTYQWLLHHLSERNDFWVATPREIAQHWSSRYRALVEASRGLTGDIEHFENADIHPHLS